MSAQIDAQPLFTLRIEVGTPQAFGTTPLGGKRFAPIVGGSFEGERLRGQVLSGADWIRIRSDGLRQIDVRASLKTDDGCLIALRYEGYRIARPEILAKDAQGAESPASEYWYRVAAFFECEEKKYGWLNRTLAVGLGTRQPPAGPVWKFYEI